MNRPRKKDKFLPQCVYFRHGAYYYQKRGKLTRLHEDLREALLAYAKLAAPPKSSGMVGLVERWVQMIEAQQPPLAKGTLSSYKYAARCISSAFMYFEPDQVRPVDVAEWVDNEATRHPAKANHMRGVLKLIMDRAVRWGLADANPVISIGRLKTEKRTRYISDSEFRAIQQAASPRLALIMDLAYLTAQRISDVLTVKVSQLTEKGIEFEPRKTKKLGKKLIVGWSPELKQVVSKISRLNDKLRGMYLFAQRNGKPIGYSAVYAEWVEACEKAGVANAHIHDIRAKSLTNADQQGLDAQKLAAHTSRKQTADYIKLRDTPVVRSPTFGRSGG